MTIDKVRVSWKGIVKNLESRTDNFLVKYWPWNQPMRYQGGNLVMLLDMRDMNVSKLMTATGNGSEIF